MGRSKSIFPFLIAAIATVPGIYARLAHVPMSAPMAALASGVAILGASFLLLWACDAVQADISPTLALAIVALIAVLPEYAVDMYFTWQAGKHPEGPSAHYAVANMTGANRLLIGVAWGAIAALFWLKHRRDVRIGRDRRTELLFLGLATLYAFVIPLKGTLAWYDGVFFLSLYVWYIVIASRRPNVETEADGPAELILSLPKSTRRAVVTIMFLFSAAAIVANAEPFCEGLVGTGRLLKINEFLLVQWLAPIASETPEFVVALVFAWRGQSGLALGSLLSSKLNQWTLLVGMIPGAFAISHGSLAHPIPMNSAQMHEILLTAAQSLLAVVLLSSLRLSMSGALLLFGLFISQLAAPFVTSHLPTLAFGLNREQAPLLFSMLYFSAAAAIFLQRPRRLASLLRGAVVESDETATEEPCQCEDEEPAEELEELPRCRRCRYRQLAQGATTNAEIRMSNE